MEESKKSNVNFHGHVLAGFDNWWRKQYGILGKNLAGILTDRCIEKNLDTYTITDDTFGNINGKSRFIQIFEEARQLKKPYEVQLLGNNAFVISKDNRETYFLDGQSLNITESGRKYELLTFGKSGLPEFHSLDEAINYLHGEGFIAIAEHPLAEGHFGSMKQELIRLCEEKKIDAVEYNSKIAVPNILGFLPVFGGFTRKRNEDAVQIAEYYNIPVVANDDADTLLQIGAAYSIMDSERINRNNGDLMVQSLNELIKENKFDIHAGYANFSDWLKFTAWNVVVKERVLGLRRKYLEKESQLN
jgi:histidinol phosphatase-like PHP family hydrolase